MIIFYHRETGKIFGCILGRVHSEYELNNKDIIEPKNVKKEDIKRKIFNLEETKKFEKRAEKNQIKIMGYDVIVGKDGEYKGLKKKKPDPKPQPNSVETIVIDLTQSLDKIKASFKKDTRSYIKKSEHLKFRQISFKEREFFQQVIKEVENLKDIEIATYLLRNRAPFIDGLLKLYLIEDDKQPLACALILSRNFKFIYKLGGVSKEGRKIHAGDAIIWNMIKDAKDLGYKEFDFGGIYADWADEKRKKVNIFKERWGGKKEKITF